MADRVNFRSFDPGQPGEAGIENERRFRAAVEEGFSTVDQTVDQVNRLIDGGIARLALEIGAVVEFAQPTAPSGWIVCDGSPVSRVTHAALFAKTGTTFGAGDGVTTFNVPNAPGSVSGLTKCIKAT